MRPILLFYTGDLVSGIVHAAYYYGIGESQILEEWTDSAGVHDFFADISDSLSVRVNDIALSRPLLEQEGKPFDENLEMQIQTGVRAESAAVVRLTEEYREAAEDLMGQTWYPGGLARGFVDVIMENASSLTNLFVERGRVLGLVILTVRVVGLGEVSRSLRLVTYSGWVCAGCTWV